MAAAVKVDAASTKAALGEAKKDSDEIKELSAKLLEAEARVLDYENRLKGFTTEFSARVEQIEKLLPGATSAGLAAAFEKQKMRFNWPLWGWNFVFVATLVALFAAASVGFPDFEPSKIDWSVILLHFLSRAPLAAPLIWLALVARREVKNSQILREEYAFKEALSMAFEGYKREMKEIGGGDVSAPIVILCNNVLAALALRPGRTLEENKGSDTPTEQLAKSVKDMVDAGARIVKPDKPPE